MKKFALILIISFLSISVFPNTPPSDADVNHVSAQKFSELIKNKESVLLDVRTAREFNSYHIEGAKLLNFYDHNFRQKVLELPKNKPIYIYCNVGNRSAAAARHLVVNGYTNVYNLQRGILEWHREGLPLIIQERQEDAVDRMNMAEFRNIVTSEKLVFFDFYAPWCRPCIQMMPMIDSLTKEYTGKINIIKINADASKPLMHELNIERIPLLVLFKNGDVVFSHSGMISRRDLEEVFQKYLNKSN